MEGRATESPLESPHVRDGRSRRGEERGGQSVSVERAVGRWHSPTTGMCAALCPSARPTPSTRPPATAALWRPAPGRPAGLCAEGIVQLLQRRATKTIWASGSGACPPKWQLKSKEQGRVRRGGRRAGRKRSLAAGLVCRSVEGLLLVGGDGDVRGGVGHARQHKAVGDLAVVQEALVALVNGARLHLAGAAGACTRAARVGQVQACGEANEGGRRRRRPTLAAADACAGRPARSCAVPWAR